MADRRPNHRAPRHTAAPSDDTFVGSFLRRLHEHVPDSSQLLGYLTLFVSSGILLLLTGLTVTLSVTGLIFLTPLIILTSPLWVPVAALVALAAAGVVSVGGFGFAALAGLSWLYKYFRGFHPPGSERADYARDRIYDTARHVKDYAREYGGYLQTKLKDVAPGA
ncbi:hypothetical protein MLD38_032819 [Melastoma candidum]|uniref:Uncharacterized protein n=1 Tax=Melastoma candidum TaxID=119954 RepID=A0ACB9M713_9MYRT|nr:hypothetical protein MLD38_032819 [Melastoma candidum]